MAEIAEAEKLCPHNSSVIAFTFRVGEQRRCSPLNIHLGEGCHECLLGALIALEQLGRKAPVAILRHSELKLDASKNLAFSGLA